MAAAIIEDFVVGRGLIVQGTSTVTSSTGQTSALQVDGGASIAKNLIVGSTATIYGPLTVNNRSLLNGKVTATGVVSITDSTAATTSSVGALVVDGGIYVGVNVVVAGTNASTSTLVNNSLYVAGGVGIEESLFVRGPAVFSNDVTFTGATTNVYSTNTVYTDNLIEVHVPSNAAEWSVDDGRDIGLRFHYFSGTGTNAALVLANDSKYLEWYGSGAESTTGTFSSAAYGTFKTGSIHLTSTETAISTVTGALQLVGGIGVSGAVYGGSDISGATITARNLTSGRIVIASSNGQLSDNSALTYNTLTNVISAISGYATTATNLASGASGSLPYQSNTGTTTFLPIGQSSYILISNNGLPAWAPSSALPSVGVATTASNIAGGSDTLIPYQIGAGSTAFKSTFAFDYNTDTLTTVNAIFTGTSNASSTITGAVQVVGGVGVGQDLYIGGNETIVGDITLNGGDINTNAATFNLINTTATTVNFAGSATTVNFAGAGTAITIGATTGYTAINNLTTITNVTDTYSVDSGALQVRGGVGVSGSMYVGNTITATNLVINGAFAKSYLGTFGNLFIDASSGNQVIQASTNNLANGIGMWTAGLANSFVYSSGGIEFLTGKTLRLNNTPTGGVIRMVISAAGNVSMTAGTASTNITTGTLVVTGGVGISGDIHIGAGAFISGDETITGNLAVNGGNITTTATTFNLVNTTATTVNFAGSGTAITIGATTGYTRINSTNNASSTITGALQVIGGVGVGQDLFVGGSEILLGDLEVRGGDITTNQTTFNLLNATASTINFAGAGTAITIGTTTGYTEIKNATTITNTTAAVSTTTGALQVRGGTGIKGELYVGGPSILQSLNATITTATTLTVIGAASVAGVLSATEGSNATLINNGALRVTGGAGISRDVVVGGLITAGVTQASTTGTSVSGFYSNNTLLASFTSNIISGSSQVDLDTFNSAGFRSARYFIQIVDGANVQISEISLFHDGVKAYLSEYGISTNNGQLGSFDATWDSSNVTVKFTPISATAMTIKMVRTTITL